ncbi:MAG: GNAT family N-acetyltransferase [Trueperaceae bacterium]|nr:GNAT family N-acetyltransferase [Trueperaceae bacterium]
MLVDLREVTIDNFEAIIELSLPDEQLGFVSSNLRSIAEARFFPEIAMRAGYVGEEPVGFTMFSLNPSDGCYWIWKLMVDGRHQRKGYGRAMMAQVLERLRTEGESRAVKISWYPDNAGAERFYLGLGFRKTGEINRGQVEAILDLHATG